jgi:hypothetical protein
VLFGCFREATELACKKMVLRSGTFPREILWGSGDDECET